MGGYWQETATATIVTDGAGDGSGSLVLNVPHRAGFLNQVTVDMTSGDGTDFLVNVYESDNSGTPYTTETNVHQVHAVATAARTEYNVRDLMKYFVADAAQGTDNQKHGRSAITCHIVVAGATASSTVVYKVRLGGIGVS